MSAPPLKNEPEKEKFKEDFSLYKTCTRFTKHSKDISHENAILYAKLSEDGCEKKSARIYSTKNFCRFDSTKSKDGPASHRILKIVPKNLLTVGNGWSISRPRYELGKHFMQNLDQILIQDAETECFDKYLAKHDRILKEEYRLRQKHTREFIKEINEVCEFKTLNKEDLMNKLQELKKRILNSKQLVDFTMFSNDSVRPHEIFEKNDKEITDDYISHLDIKPVPKSVRSSSMPFFERLSPHNRRNSIISEYSSPKVVDIDSKYQNLEEKMTIINHFSGDTKKNLKVDMKTKKIIYHDQPITKLKKDPILAGKAVEPDSPTERKKHASKIISKLRNDNNLRVNTFREIVKETMNSVPKQTKPMFENMNLNEMKKKVNLVKQKHEERIKPLQKVIITQEYQKTKSSENSPLPRSLSTRNSSSMKFQFGSTVSSPISTTPFDQRTEINFFDSNKKKSVRFKDLNL